MKTGMLLIVFGLLLPALRADHTDFVVIDATASKTYTQRKFVNGAAKPETYVLYEGKFFGGATRDPSIAHASFMDIAKVLAPNLSSCWPTTTKSCSATAERSKPSLPAAEQPTPRRSAKMLSSPSPNPSGPSA